MLVPWFNYNACSITRDSQGKRVQFARQHAKVRDFTSRHACLEVKFGFRQVQVCFIGGSLPVILSSMFQACILAVNVVSSLRSSEYGTADITTTPTLI